MGTPLLTLTLTLTLMTQISMHLPGVTIKGVTNQKHFESLQGRPYQPCGSIIIMIFVFSNPCVTILIDHDCIPNSMLVCCGAIMIMIFVFSNPCLNVVALSWLNALSQALHWKNVTLMQECSVLLTWLHWRIYSKMVIFKISC